MRRPTVVRPSASGPRFRRRARGGDRSRAASPAGRTSRRARRPPARAEVAGVGGGPVREPTISGASMRRRPARSAADRRARRGRTRRRARSTRDRFRVPVVLRAPARWFGSRGGGARTARPVPFRSGDGTHRPATALASRGRRDPVPLPAGSAGHGTAPVRAAHHPSSGYAARTGVGERRTGAAGRGFASPADRRPGCPRRSPHSGRPSQSSRRARTASSTRRP